MHKFTAEIEVLAQEVLAYSLDRLKNDPPLDGPRTAADLFAEVGNTISAKGLGGSKALALFTEVLAQACISTDHPRYLAYIPSAPSEYMQAFLISSLVPAPSMADPGKKEPVLSLQRTKRFVGSLI